MSRRGFAFLIFLLLCERTHCSHSIFYEDTENYNRVVTDHPNYKYFFFATCILLCGMIRHVLKSYEIPIPQAVFCILAGILLGIVSFYWNWLYKVVIVAQCETVIHHLGDIYIPLIIFSTAFSVDIHSFIKALPQILVISIPVSLLSAFLTGIMMKLVIDPSWSFDEAILFGVINASIYPLDVLGFLKESSVQTKYVTCLLHGETLLSTAVSIFAYVFILLYKHGLVVYWYQFVMGSVKILGLGIPIGCVFGIIASNLMKLCYNDASLLMILSVCACFSSYFLASGICYGGTISVMITGLMMGIESASLSREIKETVASLWVLLTWVLNAIVFMTIGIQTPWMLQKDVFLKDYIFACVTYLVTNISRFLIFFLFSPILSRIGYGLSFPNMMICFWCGLRSPICLVMIIDLYQYMQNDIQEYRRFFWHNLALFVLMLLINGTFLSVILRTLGLSEISLARQVNMNNCMKYIYEARARTIAILKMDRFLSDANWPLVLSSTSLKHPYKKMTQQENLDGNQDEEEFFLGYRFTYCPDCQKNIPKEPTPKEFKEMTKEAKMRLLKLKKTTYSRQYENGMISREGVRTLHQAVEIAMDSEQAQIELDGLLKMFDKESHVHRYFQRRVQHLVQSKGDQKMPRRRWKLWCYHTVHGLPFFLFINIIVVINLVSLWVELETGMYFKDNYTFSFLCDFFFFIIYFAEFVVKIIGYSFVEICRDGFKTYFRSFFNIMEFLSLLCALTESIKEILAMHYMEPKHFFYVNIVWSIFLVLRLFKILLRFRMWGCLKSVPNIILRELDTKVNKHRTLAFELGKNYIAGEEEILENLHNIVDNKKIRAMLKSKTDFDRQVVTRKLGIAQKGQSGVASTVKTKTMIRAALNSMREDIAELKISGWVDDIEYNKLLRSLAERYKYVNAIRYIAPPTPKLIFKEIPFMGDDDEMLEFLYSHISTKKYDPGNVVLEEGENVDGIYILITGLLVVTFLPNEAVNNLLKETGILPAIDHLCSNTYDEPISEYFLPGNSIGELAAITGRPYDGTVTAETHSEMYFLKSSIVQKAVEMDPDPVNGFECRIWKSIAIRIAVDVMMDVPFYRSFTQDNIKYILERSFVPDLSNYKIFVVNDMMQDIVLVEGMVVDYNTRDVYTAPCYIPRSVQKLVLPKSSLIDMLKTLESKLMIIPAKDYDEYEIMMTEEQTCELVNANSSKCLRHLLREKSSLSSKSSKSSKGSKQQKEMRMGITKQLRKKLVSSQETVKSKITFASSMGSKVSSDKTSKPGTKSPPKSVTRPTV